MANKGWAIHSCIVVVRGSERVSHRACHEICIVGCVHKFVVMFPDALSVTSRTGELKHNGSNNAHVCRLVLIMDRTSRLIDPTSICCWALKVLSAECTLASAICWNCKGVHGSINLQKCGPLQVRRARYGESTIPVMICCTCE